MVDIVNTYLRRFYPDLRDVKFAALEGEGRVAVQRAGKYPDVGWRRRGNIEKIFPRMFCTDGFSMSVQARTHAYCKPRDDFADEYSQFEIGYPSEREELLMDYANDEKQPTRTFYVYVPLSVVEAVIAKHGGLTEQTDAKEAP